MLPLGHVIRRHNTAFSPLQMIQMMVYLSFYPNDSYQIIYLMFASLIPNMDGPEVPAAKY